MKPISKLEEILNLPSPLEKLALASAVSKNIDFWIKRDELIHPEISGNKWRKLKYNLMHALDHQLSPIVSFGGAFSNHIYALSAAAEKISIPSIGIIRGQYVNLENPTLKFAAHKAMELYKVDHEAYQQKEKSEQVKAILLQYPTAMCIPEGGSNHLATKGTTEITLEINQQLGKSPDYIILAAGTGATSAGVINGADSSTKVLVINALKNQALESEIKNLLENKVHNFEVCNQYHHGGFAKTNPILIQYINAFKHEYNIQLEPIYTAKMMMAIEDMIQTGFIENGKTIVAIHSGGLQGIQGHNKRYEHREEMQIKLS